MFLIQLQLPLLLNASDRSLPIHIYNLMLLLLLLWLLLWLSVGLILLET